MLVLQCNVHGKKASDFLVSIDEDASVGELLEAILRDHQYSMPCSIAELTLSSEAQDNDDKSGDNYIEMDQTKALKEYFPSRPSFQQGELYRVLITLPALLNPNADATSPVTKKRKVSESEGSPLDRETASEPEVAEIPVTLLCAVFGAFEDNCKHGGLVHLAKKDCELVFFLCRALAEDYSSDGELESVLKDLIGDYILADYPVSPMQQQQPPRSRAILPFKLRVHNGRASTNSNVYLENLPSKVDGSVPLPYFLLEISGLFLRVYGVVSAGKKLVCEPLVSSVPLIWLDKLNLMEATAQTCAALKIAVQELRTAQFKASANSSLEMKFPYRSTAVIYGERITIQYEERLQGLVFVAGIVELGGCDVIVKFAKLRYGREVHEHCAAKGLAPALLAHEELPGGWHFCVMERVESAMPIWEVERSIVEPKLREILRVLHTANFVHGDLRIYNILWDSDSQQPKLVDFDWAGVQGTTKYPSFLCPEVAWPKGVETNKVIAFAHDAVWIDEFLDLPPRCSTDEEKQFTVKILTNDPLGLRLSEKLEVLEFVADAQGRSRAVEASGLAEIGDRLIQVNDESLLGRSLANAVAALTSASLPRLLRFQTHDGRCQTPPAQVISVKPQGESRTLQAVSSDENAEDGGELDATKVAVATYDYLLLSLGEKDSEMTFYGVLSAEGKPPSCTFREVEIAFPFDACSSLSSNGTGKYVVVSTMSGCPAHQKAAFVQDSGATGVIFIQHDGKKPQQIKLPSELPKPIELPLVMVTMDSGMQIVDQINGAHPTQTPRVRFVFSEECAADKFQVHPDEDPLLRSVQALVQSAVAGFLLISTADSGSAEPQTVSYEFLKPADEALETTKLPLGKHDLYFPDRTLVRPCEDLRSTDMSSRILQTHQQDMTDKWVVLTLQTKCSLLNQLQYFAAMRAGGVIFGDPEFPKSASVSLLPTAFYGGRGYQQLTSIPFVVVSLSSLRFMQRNPKRKDSTAHIQVEFAGENALQHHWRDLAELSDPGNWPSSENGRDRLFHRVLKDHTSISDQDARLQLVRNERYETLVALYWQAQRFYSNPGSPEEGADELEDS